MSDALAIHEAFTQGDLDALKAALGHPPDFPNCRTAPQDPGCVLEYAFYHSSLAFIRRLLEHGADPNYGDAAGQPEQKLINAGNSGRFRPITIPARGRQSYGRRMPALVGEHS